MKRYYYLLALAAAVVFASCVRDVAVSDASAQEDGIGDYDDRLVVPSWIRIRLDDESSPLRTGVFTRGEADSGNPVLDELAASLGATEIRQVFPTTPASRHATADTDCICGSTSGSERRCPCRAPSRSSHRCRA